MVLGTIIAIIMLAAYGIAMTIGKYMQDKTIDKIINDYADLSSDYVKALSERDKFKVEIESQKDTIADLSRQINKATVKTVPDENPSETKSEEPKKEKTKKTTTTKKTTKRKTNTKKKEVK